MVSRSEIDLFNIRKEFRKNFVTSLYSMIKVELRLTLETQSQTIGGIQETGERTQFLCL